MTRGGRIDPMQFPEGLLDSDDRIDVAIAESFPASDPPSWNSGLDPEPKRAEAPHPHETRESSDAKPPI